MNKQWTGETLPFWGTPAEFRAVAKAYADHRAFLTGQQYFHFDEESSRSDAHAVYIDILEPGTPPDNEKGLVIVHRLPDGQSLIRFAAYYYLDNVTLDICAKNRGLPGPSLEPQHGVASLSQADAPLPSQLVQGQEDQNRPAKRCVCRTCV